MNPERRSIELAEPRGSIAAIIPCAGESRRMGEDKALLDAGGQSFLARVVGLLADRCDPVLVVVRSERTDIAAEARRTGATVLLNPDPSDGPISSLRVAIGTLIGQSECDGAMVLPVDHPAVAASTVEAVLDAFRKEEAKDDRRTIVVPVVDGRTGHPPLFGRAIFDELLDPRLEGGARTIVHANPERVLKLSVNDPGIVLDIDTPADWQAAVAAGELAPPMTAPLSIAQAAEIAVSGVDSGREVLILARLDPLPAARMAIVASPDRSSLEVHGSLGSAALDAAARDRALALLAGRLQGGEVELEGVRLYAEAHRPIAELIIVGAGHISLPLAEVGQLLGLRVRVLDDRPEFARQERFPDSVDVRHVDFARAFDGIPIGPLTHVVLVTRGHKYDYECLLQLLRLPVTLRYIGMIGSRRRVRATWVQLLEEGIDRERIRSIRAPVGLDLGAETPGEIAVAVAAEIVREWRGGTGDPLREKERILDRFFDEQDKPDAAPAEDQAEEMAR